MAHVPTSIHDAANHVESLVGDGRTITHAGLGLSVLNSSFWRPATRAILFARLLLELNVPGKQAMSVDQRVIQRLDELLAMGETVLATRRERGPNLIGDDRVDQALVHQWLTSVQSLLVRVFGLESAHAQNLAAQVEKYVTFAPALRAQGVLRAAKEDYERGYLFNVRRMVEAEVFDDFLEQADYLLNAGYFQPAAVVAGAVLEDGLRKLCAHYGIPLASAPKLDAMNAALAKAGAYSVLAQKRITTMADLRNRAAHGRWDSFSAADVEDMLTSVRRFMEDHFA